MLVPAPDIVDLSAHKALLCDGIDTAIKALVLFPQDDAIAKLIADAQRLRREVEAWTSPTPAEIARAEQHVLSLNVAASAMNR